MRRVARMVPAAAGGCHSLKPLPVQDLVTLVIDVGPTAHAAAPAWPEVVQRIMANRMIVDKPHMELAIIAYGSDTTHNALWDPSSPDEYKGIHVITVRPLLPPALPLRLAR